jgi:hypothetical protein
MRYLHTVVIAGLVAGCGEDSAPTQPGSGRGAGEAVVSKGVEAEGAIAATGDGLIRGFAIMEGGVSIPIGTSFTPIQKLSLPAGKYIANASAVLAIDVDERHFIDCIFLINGGIQGDAAKGTIGGNGFGDHTSLPLTIGFSLSAPADLVLGCQSEVSGLIFSQTSHITAIRVDRLTIQQP